MRAKTIFKTAVVFDFDDTLIRDTARSHLYRDGKYVRSLNADEFNHYVKKDNETFDFSEFDNPGKIKGEKGPAWNDLINSNGHETFIVTARRETAKFAIYDFLIRNSISKIPFKNIYCIGGPEVLAEEIPLLKERIILQKIKPHFDKVILYDDNDLTINHLKNIPGISTVLVQ